MKRLLLVLMIGAAASPVLGEPGRQLATNDIRHRIDAAFDRSRLKSIIMKYERKITGLERDEDHREIFLVLDGKKLFIRMQYHGPWTETDYTVDPPIVTTNWSPNISYLWWTGEYKVDGSIHPDISWEIYPSGTRTPEDLDEQVFGDVELFLYLTTPTFSRNLRFLGERPSPGGRTYLFKHLGTGIDVEYTVSDTDGDGVAPIREVNSKEGRVLQDATWSGWKNYNGIWVPQHHIGFSTTGNGKALIEEYRLLRVEKVNEPIHARWFMPQFPARHVRIVDNTVSPPLEMDNIDLDGNPYPAPEVQDMEGWEAEEGEEESSGVEESSAP